MKNFFKIFGIIVLVAVIVFSMAGCDAECPTCNGTGKCSSCQGSGKFSSGYIDDNTGTDKFSSNCSSCNGSGNCQSCDGKGRISPF